MYPFALEQGILPDTFWQSSVLEIQDMLEAYQNRKKQQFRDDVLIGFASADATATRVAYFFTEAKKRKQSDIIQPWDSFPSLFDNPKEKASADTRNAEMEKYKSNMIAFAERWNRRNKNVTEADI